MAKTLKVRKGPSSSASKFSVGTKKKGKAGAWIMHVKAFCKKTGKTFPEALKDPMCKKSYKK